LITVAKPHDIIIIQMPDEWTPNQIQDEQDRLTSLAKRELIQAKFVVVPGGSPAMWAPTIHSVKTG
jgi:hypothetical protein